MLLVVGQIEKAGLMLADNEHRSFIFINDTGNISAFVDYFHLSNS